MKSWKEMIEKEMQENNDIWSNVISCTLSEKELIKEFHEGFGLVEGEPFTVWTETRVYFPVCYDGNEWCGSVSRYPDGIATNHMGGG